jgi:cobalt/nickel transport system ATP-binding protein
MQDSPILALENITFGHAGRPALFNGLCFALRPRERIGLYGPNGSGKTTLLRLAMGLETPQRGGILFHGVPVDGGRSLRRLRCGIGFVLQNSDDQLFSPTVLEDVAFGPLNLGLNRHEARARAMETLESMGLAAYADRRTHRLSGGEKKMVCIACVLSMRPEALLLDEPTAFLDDDSRDRIISILRQQQRDIAGIVVSHDREFLEQTAHSLVRIENGTLQSLPEQ